MEVLLLFRVNFNVFFYCIYLFWLFFHFTAQIPNALPLRPLQDSSLMAIPLAWSGDARKSTWASAALTPVALPWRMLLCLKRMFSLVSALGNPCMIDYEFRENFKLEFLILLSNKAIKKKVLEYDILLCYKDLCCLVHLKTEFMICKM